MENYNNNGLMYRRARNTFTLLIFTLAGAFVLMAMIQWIILLIEPNIQNFFIANSYVPTIILFFGLIAISVFALVNRVRFIVPLNWIMIFFIVECLIWGCSRIILISDIENLGYCLLAVTFYVVSLILTAGCMKFDLTLHVVYIFFGSLLLMMLGLIFVIVDIFALVPYAAYVYITITIIIATTFLLYHAQVIIGGRYAEMRLNDYLLAALLVFSDFIMLFIITFFLALKIEN